MRSQRPQQPLGLLAGRHDAHAQLSSPAGHVPQQPVPPLEQVVGAGDHQHEVAQLRLADELEHRLVAALHQALGEHLQRSHTGGGRR